nr:MULTISPECIES: hypothetical protein [Providencia]
MRFNLTQVNILEENTKVTGLHITLIGDDNSTHTLKMDIKGLDTMNMSLRDIEKYAIKQLKHSFEHCSNGWDLLPSLGNNKFYCHINKIFYYSSGYWRVLYISSA